MQKFPFSPKLLGEEGAFGEGVEEAAVLLSREKHPFEEISFTNVSEGTSCERPAFLSASLPAEGATSLTIVETRTRTRQQSGLVGMLRSRKPKFPSDRTCS